MIQRGIRIGTSGWHYKEFYQVVYPAGLPASRMLEYYACEFDSVEVNNSFYKLPDIATFRKWRAGTPPGFLFSLKASRFITHLKRLQGDGVEEFILRARVLEDKLGPILFQLPPRWQCDLERLDGFLSRLPRDLRYTMEFRDRSWFNPETYELLRSHNIALSFFQLAGFQSPLQSTSDFIYVRLHGPQFPYQGSYSNQELAEWVKRLLKWQSQGKDVFLYFDNTAEGMAAINASQLKSFLKNAVARAA